MGVSLSIRSQPLMPSLKMVTVCHWPTTIRLSLTIWAAPVPQLNLSDTKCCNKHKLYASFNYLNQISHLYLSIYFFIDFFRLISQNNNSLCACSNASLKIYCAYTERNIQDTMKSNGTVLWMSVKKKKKIHFWVMNVSKLNEIHRPSWFCLHPPYTGLYKQFVSFPLWCFKIIVLWHSWNFFFWKTHIFYNQSFL